MSKNFGFLLFKDVEELDLIGPWEMISVWHKSFQGPYSPITISQNKGMVSCAHGLQVNADYSFEDCPPLDYLLVPGGMGTRVEVNNPLVVNFIRKQATECRLIASVCTGSLLLQAADLLKERTVTTHWASLERLKQFPELTVQEERFVKDGNIWSSAGISAGIDMTLALIAELAGKEIAGKVQLQTEYFPDQQCYVNLAQEENLPAYLK